ncbi:helix-turn-helix domain-containing protein [Actinomadura algeriensis]|uniref:HTH cro/C1-type domain-containing protein n=1 Tax=Actinomadura algeriensis TaxID=1679523 RepID=A0ABR9JMV5_9ACTN|nr:helix-turn-helix transcriptional regulator [Actinomadura algeriensis]MBE1531893.1 hypothetical protein [Actinomadura algeriensis]
MSAVPERRSPSIRRRRLSRELRKLRVEAGQTAEEVWRALEWSQGKLSRIEQNDWRRPDPRDVRDMLDHYGVADEAKREALIGLARESRIRGWWETSEFAGLFQHSLVGFEQEATRIYSYQPLVIPGLLQTPAYARAIVRSSLVHDPAEIQRRVDFRMHRQEILKHPSPPLFWAIIDEAALRRPFGTVGEREEQIQRLIDTGNSDHITVQIVPFDAGLHAGLTFSFAIMDYEDDPSIAYIELESNALYLEKPDDLRAHTLRFQHLQSTALNKDATTRWLGELLNSLK